LTAPRLTVCLPSGAPAWADALQAALPDWAVSAWQPGAPPADYAVLWKPPAAFFAEQTQLRAALAAGAGVDALLALNPPPQLPIYRLEDAGMGVQMAEYALHAVLRWFRQFDVYAAQAAQAQWQPLPPQDKADWPIGLLGSGVLAQPVAQALQGLGFEVQAWARQPRPGSAWPVHTGTEGLHTLLRRSRVVVALLPLTADTRHVLNTLTLALMPASSYLINLARGGLVDEAALLHALDTGHLAGAALDVCAVEPAAPEHPFWRHPRVQLTPHVAAATLRGAAVAQMVGKLRGLVRGDVVSGLVGDAGY
jgi:glyoxylate/hydroxypyruvate reductase A